MLEAIKELLGAVRAHIQERAASPLTGAFVVSWCIWNFKLLLVVLGDGSYREKISFIETGLYGGSDQGILRGIVFPLLTALAYIFVYPAYAKRVMEHHKTQQNEIRALAIKIDGERVLTEAQATELRRQQRRREGAWARERADLEGDIANLRELLTAEQKKNDGLLSASGEKVNEALNEEVASLRKLYEEQRHRYMDASTARTVLENQVAELKARVDASPARSREGDDAQPVIGWPPNAPTSWKIDPTHLLLATESGRGLLARTAVTSDMRRVLASVADETRRIEGPIPKLEITSGQSRLEAAVEILARGEMLQKWEDESLRILPSGHEVLGLLERFDS